MVCPKELKTSQLYLQCLLLLTRFRFVKIYNGWSYNKWHSIVLQDLTQRLGFEPQPSPAIDSNLSFSSQITSHNQTHEEYFDHWPIFLTHAKNSLAHLTRDKTRCGRDSLFPLRNDNFCTMDEKKQVMENSLSSMIKRLINDDSSNSAQRHDLLSHFKFGFL